MGYSEIAAYGEKRAGVQQDRVASAILANEIDGLRAAEGAGR
jgi:hypothetical protein